MPNASLYLFRYWLINNKDNNEHFLKNQTKNALDFQFEKFSRTLFSPYYDSTSVLNVIDIVDDDLKEKALICTTRRE
jgi:LytS/YehU family sensor histidine kinase